MLVAREEAENTSVLCAKDVSTTPDPYYYYLTYSYIYVLLRTNIFARVRWRECRVAQHNGSCFFLCFLCLGL